jgi:nitroimidazol reductase NimA-like FMN-containing flavoprotein (pyridoxamine 5'-phosphate oxidase superfamily)
MFIHEMSASECREALAHARVGRLACARDNQPYIVPMNYAADGDYLYVYGFTTVGQKVEWMRSNPLVCFEIDDVVNHNHWMSVIVFGQYEELPEKAEFESARKRAFAHIQKRVMWWEPAYISQDHRDQPNSLIPLFFRIKVEKMTGHRANPDNSEAAITTPAATGVEPQSRQTNARERPWTRILRAALVYFVIVFGAGSVLGPIRTLLLVPRVGERIAELIELPVMLIVILMAAKFIVHRFQLPPHMIYRLGAGVIAFALGIVFEFGLVLKVTGVTLTEYFHTRDPVATAAYYISLVLLALMPLMVGRNVIGSVQKRKTRHHAESNSSHGLWPEDTPAKINAQH